MNILGIYFYCNLNIKIIFYPEVRRILYLKTTLSECTWEYYISLSRSGIDYPYIKNQVRDGRVFGRQ